MGKLSKSKKRHYYSSSEESSSDSSDSSVEEYLRLKRRIRELKRKRRRHDGRRVSPSGAGPSTSLQTSDLSSRGRGHVSSHTDSEGLFTLYGITIKFRFSRGIKCQQINFAG